MNLLTLLLQTTDTLVTPPVLTPTVETAGDLNLWELACKGGIIMIPLLLLSLLSIYIFFERQVISLSSVYWLSVAPVKKTRIS